VLELQRDERQTKAGGIMFCSTVKVEYKFHTTDGSSIAATLMGEGMDSGDKSLNKALSAAYKYLMFQVFCIPTEEMQDSETESPETTPKTQHSQEATKPEANPNKFHDMAFAMCSSQYKMTDEQMKATILGFFPNKQSRKELTEDDWEKAVNSLRNRAPASVLGQISALINRIKVNGKAAFSDINDPKLANYLSQHITSEYKDKKIVRRVIKHANELTHGEAIAFINYLEGLPDENKQG